MKAIWNGQVVAEATREEVVYIEGNWYFPPAKVNKALLRDSATPYNCPWKGVCSYFDVGQANTWAKDSAWTYKTPKQSAVDIVKKDFANYIAFWHDVKVEQ